MTTEHDARTRTVVAWLREDAHENAERVLLSALNEVDHTQQRRARWPALRFPAINGPARLVATAAVVGATLLAFALLPLAAGPGGAPSATTSPTPTVVPSDAGPLTPVNGQLAARTYRIPSSPSILLTFPEGWAAAGEGVIWNIRKNWNEPDEVGIGLWAPDISVYPDACANDVNPPLTGPTADDLIAALEAQANSSVSEPVDVTVGGLPGQRVDITVPDDLDMTQCYEDIVRIWTGSNGGNYLAFGPEPRGIVAPVYIVETASGRIVLGWRSNPKASAADNAELDAIVASMVIED